MKVWGMGMEKEQGARGAGSADPDPGRLLPYFRMLKLTVGTVLSSSAAEK